MLDLQPIKNRLSETTRGVWTQKRSGFLEVLNTGEPLLGIQAGQPVIANPCDATFIEHAKFDVDNLLYEVERLENEAAVMQQVTLAGLAAEVERLRVAIYDHREKLTADSLHDLADRELWEALDA